MIAPDRPHQHNDLPGSEARTARIVPSAGPIAIEPFHNELFIDAVRQAGGEVAPLSSETRGLVWLSEKDSGDLATIVKDYPHIEWVQLPWAGVDGFADLFAMMEHKTAPVFTSAKGSYAEPVAEHALTLVLSLAREIPRKSREKGWQAARTGLSLYGNNVVIIGAGGITMELVRLLEPFRTNITVVRRQPHAVAGAHRTVTTDQLHEVLADADVVVLAAAATAETKHLLGATELSLLPNHAIIVNVARGSLLDDEAARTAIREGRLWGIGLDVTSPEPLPTEHPLWDEPNCIITSHSADTPLMTKHLLAARIRTNVTAFLAGTDMLGVVDTRSGY
ncbi:MAG: NAD(P)-dependent oxidoreductase [Microbacteriaceae bacterium]